MSRVDAVIIGAGPNGLTAAVVLARAGLSVVVLEGADRIGGGTRSESLTLPGFTHDVCSAIHPLAAASPVFAGLPLAAHGLEWIDPPVALAHPLDDEDPALLLRDIDATADQLGADAGAYRALVGPLVRDWPTAAPDVLAPLHWPAHPVQLARFGIRGLQPIAGLVRRTFRTARARALFAGIATHALRPLDSAGTSALALVLATAAHHVGWPIPRGGSVRIAEALASYLRTLGGRIETGRPVRALADLPPARAILFDTSPHAMLDIVGDRFPPSYREAIRRFRYGPGVFKVDWALSAPVPWRWPACRDAGTLHLGGTLDDVAASEWAIADGHAPQRPTVLIAQPSVWDASRAPAGHHTLWGYCHVPNGSPVDMLARIEAQVDRFAPGFADCIVGRSVLSPAALEAHNPNLVGGDIGQGAYTLRQLFFRPVVSRRPCATPARGIYLCSASTPPGGGVHGMCGWYAARAALSDVFGVRASEVMSLARSAP